VVAALAVGTGCRHEAAPAFDMPAVLAELAARQAAWDNPWEQGSAKAAELRAALSRERDPRRRLDLQRELARQHLYSGKVEAAIAVLGDALESPTLSASARRMLQADLALAWLRLGEQQNCVGGHSSAACIFPITEAGLHRRKLGATQAVGEMTALLGSAALGADEALAWRWLRHVARMTLGEHTLDDASDLPGPLFPAEHDIGRFHDVAAARGVAHFGRAGGAILDDFNGDGHLDLLLGSWGLRDPLVYYVNDGHGRFTARAPEQTGLSGISGGLQLVQADYDNDGRLDALVLRGAWLHGHGRIPNSLLRNNGDGTFSDVTAQAGLLSYHPTQTAAWADIDVDGDLDLFVGNEVVREHVDWPAGAKAFELYRNDGNGRFTEVSDLSGIALSGMIKGAAFGDIDDDGLPDLFVSRMGAANRLFRNLGANAEGIPRFEDVTARAGVGEPTMSFACWFWDFDNDGREDLLVFGYSATLADTVRDGIGVAAGGERPRLYRNLGDGRFEDVTSASGLDRVLLAMGADYGDLDNDGWLDFYAGTGSPALEMLTPNRMFRNDGGRRFQDITTSGGFGHLQKGHGVAFGDVDSDGDQDVFELIGGAYEADAFYSVLFDNPGHGHRWLTLRLEGVGANRSAIGARIAVEVEQADHQLRTLHRTVGAASSFGGSSLQAEIGLGDARAIRRITVRWPGGAAQRIEGPVAMNRIYRLRENAPLIAVTQ
jgi:hypothetical protein